MDIPRRQSFTPGELTPHVLDESADDASRWRQFFSHLRTIARSAGFVLTFSVKPSGSASWWNVRAVMTRAGASCPDIEVFPVSGPLGDDSGCIVRQWDREHGWSGPNHSTRMRTAEDVLIRASVLTLRPFDRDRCSHCDRDEGRRPAVAATWPGGEVL